MALAGAKGGGHGGYIGDHEPIDLVEVWPAALPIIGILAPDEAAATLRSPNVELKRPAAHDSVLEMAVLIDDLVRDNWVVFRGRVCKKGDERLFEMNDDR